MEGDLNVTGKLIETQGDKEPAQRRGLNGWSQGLCEGWRAVVRLIIYCSLLPAAMCEQPFHEFISPASLSGQNFTLSLERRADSCAAKGHACSPGSLH